MTFEQVCQAAKRRTGRWFVTDMGKVRCALGYCPLGRVFTYGKNITPWNRLHSGIAAKALSERTWLAVMSAADDRDAPGRKRLLKLLGVRP